MNDRIEALIKVREWAKLYLENSKTAVPAAHWDALATVDALLHEAGDADAIPAQKAKLATEVLEPFHIETIMAVSTSHVSTDTMKKLTKNQIEQLNVKRFGDYGVVLYLFPDQGSWNEVHEGCVNLLTVPDDVFAAMAHARGHGCTWLLLDADAPEIAGLDTYDW